MINLFLMLLAAVMCVCAGSASAQLLEDMEVHVKEGHAAVVIKLSVPVHYLRHFPASKGDNLQIYFDILASDSEMRSIDETRKSPPGVVPSFAVVVHDQNTQPKLSIQFDHEVSYEVRAGSDNRSFILTMPVIGAEGERLLDLPEEPEEVSAPSSDNAVATPPAAAMPDERSVP